MLSALKFVKGAVAKRDFVPALTHFRISGGTVRSFNGKIGLSSPIEVDLDIAPNAEQFVKAIDACGDETISLHMDKKQLVVRAGRFKTRVDCIDVKEIPSFHPRGKRIEMTGTLLPALQALESLMAVDASRPWACGILFEGEVAVATNNIILAQYWIGFEIPQRLNIPGEAVAALVNIGEEPKALYIDNETVYFDFGDEKWLMTQLLVAPWPDANAVIDAASVELLPEAIPEGFFDALDAVLPFVDAKQSHRVYFDKGTFSTMAGGEGGTQVEFPEIPSTGCFNAVQLRKLKELAQTINFSAYPKPVYFEGERTRGVIVPLRVS